MSIACSVTQICISKQTVVTADEMGVDEVERGHEDDAPHAEVDGIQSADVDDFEGSDDGDSDGSNGGERGREEAEAQVVVCLLRLSERWIDLQIGCSSRTG